MRAAARLTPHMTTYQLKRLVRNKVVPLMPVAYERFIHSTARTFPVPANFAGIPEDVAEFVGRYYREEEDHIRDAANGRFTILGRTVDFGSVDAIDWAFTHPDEKDVYLWRSELAHLKIVHSLIANGRSEDLDIAVTILRTFRHRQSFRGSEAFAVWWSPYAASHRLLSILSALSLALREATLIDSRYFEILDFVQLDAGFLWRNIEYELRNNHTERNLAALCLYYMACCSISPKRAKTLDRSVRRIITQTMLPDGMQVERTAMYQSLTLMSLRIFAASRFLSEGTRALAEKNAVAAARALKFMTHPDGEISLFNDSWIGEAPSPENLFAGEDIQDVTELSASGFFKLVIGEYFVLFDAGEIGPACSPAHGHADFLAMEVDAFGRRLIVDPGTSSYSTGLQRAWERSAAAHNGPRYHGIEPVEYIDSFRVGVMTRAEALDPSVLSRLPVKSIGGRVLTSAGSCVRVVCGLPGGGIAVVDYWDSADREGRTGLLVPHEWKIEPKLASKLNASTQDVSVDVTVVAGEVADIKPSAWSRHYMRTELATAISLVPEYRDRSQWLAFGIGADSDTELSAVAKEIVGVVESLR